MAGVINIGEANQGDAFYRYKMPKLQARIEGRGNGIKTNVVNNVEIAKALERPPDYVVKYFGCELGAQTKFDKASGTSIVNGAHESARLSELLEGFIKRYVQCYSCGNPETQVKIRKDAIFLKCKACGATSTVDMRHKLNTYILKNPPEEKVSKAEKKLKKLEKERLKEAAGENLDKEEKKRKKKDSDKKKKKGDTETETGSGSNDDDADEEDTAGTDDVVWSTDTSAEAAKRRAEEQLTNAMAAMVTQGNIEAEAEAARKREEKRRADEEAAKKAAAEEARKAARKREEKRRADEEAAKKAAAEEARKAEEKRVAEEAAAAEAARNAANPAVQLRHLLSTGKSAREVAVAVKKLEVDGGLAGRMRVLYEALFGEEGDAKLAPLVAKHKAILKNLATEPASQIAQLVALEHLLGVTHPAKLSQVSLVLKALYDEDIADEELIVAWFDKGAAGKVLGIPAAAAKSVRDAAKPLVEWLKEAESDEEDSEEDE
ncbi:hypothetical protein WJX72_012368 [[Myrmecia] bisecta]|uniref:W2 domain-containing protein n=1 Tax=[Myrmecia] bisecta TaxID=41462 RepID=A0AAW1RAR3_9CHLO